MNSLACDLTAKIAIAAISHAKGILACGIGIQINVGTGDAAGTRAREGSLVSRFVITIV